MSDQTRVYELLFRWEERNDAGREITPEELCAEQPELLEEVQQGVARLRLMAGRLDGLTTPPNASASTPLELPPSTSRYRFEEFIARGGMGEVYRGEDTVLRRTVALKVLRQRLGVSAGKFRSEAQLVARLAHPGIVPVHDFGELSDGRPFFAMKLVEGKTLEEVLGDSNAQSPQLPRWLQYFEQICQAVAYAHSQNPPLLHRDLKPQNVMIGAYGEVLVMDWGIARVVAEASSTNEVAVSPEIVTSDSTVDESMAGETPNETATGVAKGTVAYMAPEQARGKRDQIGPHSDVFGLGGILCRMLTGKPTFVGDESWTRAVKGDVVEPYERLDRCVADAGLIEIAKKCLAAKVGERYADARTVASAIREHQDEVQQRINQAEIEAARAQTRVEAERRKRRYQFGLSVTAFSLVFVIGAGLWWAREQRHQSRERQQRIDEVARASMTEARRLLEESRRHLPGDNARFREAQTAAANAVDIAKEGGSPSVQAETKELLAQANRDCGQAVKNQRLLNDLMDVHVPRETRAYRRDQSGTMLAVAEPSIDDQYRAVFRNWGLPDIDSSDLSDLTALLASQPERFVQEVVSGLDEWARKQLRGGLTATGQRLTALANRLDNNARRRSLRFLVAEGELDRELIVEEISRLLLPFSRLLDRPEHGPRRAQLKTLAVQMDVSSEPPLAILALARTLVHAGLVLTAESLLGKALTVRPGELILRNALGVMMASKNPPDLVEAVRHHEAARSIRPDLGIALSKALSDLGRSSDAVAILRDLIRRTSNSNPELHLQLGLIAGEAGKQLDAEAEFRKAIALNPKMDAAHTNLGVTLYEQGEYAEAEFCFLAAIYLKPDDPAAYYNLGNALLLQDLFVDAEAAFRKATDLQPHFSMAFMHLGRSLDEQGKNVEAETAYRQAIIQNNRNVLGHNNLADFLRRQGRLVEAEQTCRAVCALTPEDANALNNLANMQSDQKDFGRAEATLRRAIGLKPDFAGAYLNLANALYAQKRYEEAEAASHQAIAKQADYADACWSLGLALHRQNKLIDAETAFREAIKRRPRSADLYVCLANVLYDRANYPAAEAAFCQAIVFGTESANTHLGLGNALYKQAKYAEAETAFRKATELRAVFPSAWSNLISALGAQGKVKEAEVAFRTAVAQQSIHPEAYVNLGSVYRGQGKQREAEAAFRKAIAQKPDNAVAHENLGCVLHDLRQFAAAEDSFLKALEFAPNDARIYFNLGNALLSQVKYAAANKAYRRAIDKDYHQAYGNLGRSLLETGNYLEAVQAFQAAAKYAPNDAVIRDLLRSARRSVELDRLFFRLIATRTAPTDANTQCELAEFCAIEKECYVATVRLYLAAFQSQPNLMKDIRAAHRYRAACSAGLVAKSIGFDAQSLTEEDCLGMSRLARSWLAADLDEFARIANGSNASEREFAGVSLKHWLQSDDLASVRLKQSLTGFPPSERSAWEAFWSEVQAVQRLAQK